MIVIAGKNDIAVHGLFLAMEFFDLDKIIVIPNKNDLGVDGWQRSLSKAAKDNNIVIKNLNEVYDTEIDCFISLEFDQLIKPAMLSTESVYNIHFSKLPEYKGMYTSVWPILFCDKNSGVTLHKIDKGIDTGDIVSQRVFDLNASDRSQDCYRKYIDNAKLLISEWFERIINKNITYKKQSAIRSTYYSASSIDYKNLKINFKRTAWQIKRQVYAFSFRPYQLLTFEGLDISDVIITNNKSVFPPGTIISKELDYFSVSSVDYDVKLYFDDLDNILQNMNKMNVESFSKKMVNILGVNDRNGKGWSPIIVAAYYGRVDLIAYLLDNGALINDRNYRGTAVLMYAKDYSLKHKDNKVIKYLINHGADPMLKDWSGKTIYDYITKQQVGFLDL
ncbi:formyltransferase family protein [Psychrobacter sp. 72-O-c]|uniref:formyltransferase family protein n=1 Tax=Psychrobacter sp. 72-O-c TaxID=2774125 RepID=UPI00191920B0|nr:formyltransferase family protein [Psychrobacter sp. 72-O-c]